MRMQDHTVASQSAFESMSELRARLDEPWEDIEIPEERRTQSSGQRTPEDMMWFGSVGYDPSI